MKWYYVASGYERVCYEECEDPSFHFAGSTFGRTPQEAVEAEIKWYCSSTEALLTRPEVFKERIKKLEDLLERNR